MSYDISLLSSQTTLASSAATSSSTSTTTTSTATTSAEESKEMFLELLLTQLENQDPLDPVDTTEFTSQLVSYASLEQQIESNEKLDEVVSALSGGSSFSALSFVGSTVDVDGSTSVVQDGEATWSYAVSEDAASVVLQLTDADGNVIETVNVGALDAGTYQFTLNAEDYAALSEDETVNLSVTALDSSGNAIDTDVSGKVDVDSVETDTSGNITLWAGQYVFSSDYVSMLYNS